MSFKSKIKLLWSKFLCLFTSEKPSSLVTELMHLLAQYPDEFSVSLAHYDDVPTVCLRLDNEVVQVAPALGSVICIQPSRMFLDGIDGDLIELSRPDRQAIMVGVDAWARS